MEGEGVQHNIMDYFGLIEYGINSGETDMDTILKNDAVKKEKLYNILNREIEKIAKNKHEEVDGEIEQLHKRVDVVFDMNHE